MGRSASGRIVLEISPELKRRLHARLAAEGRTLKDWFLEAADKYLAGPIPVQLQLEMKRSRTSTSRAKRIRGSKPK